MKVVVDDAALAYVYNLLNYVLPTVQGPEKKVLKTIIRRLSPPRQDVKLSGKQTEMLVAILGKSLQVLEGRTDEHSVKVRDTLTQMKVGLDGSL